MKHIITSFAVLVLCCLAMPQALAVGDAYWSETVSLSGTYAEFGAEDFDFVAVHLPPFSTAQMLTATGWEPLQADTEHHPDLRVSELIPWDDDRPLLLRFGGRIPQRVTADFMRLEPLAESYTPLLASNAQVTGAGIVKRRDWGANEDWRYAPDSTVVEKNVEEKNSDSSARTPSAREQKCNETQETYPDEFVTEHVQRTEGGRKLRWPYQYSKKVRKVVLHHTAETGVSNGRQADEVMRAIYRYHTVSRGWGDIGYHYVIAPDGTIFEGRAGGAGVVGGHVYCNNIGTIGVALMGNFNDQEPTRGQISALRQLLPQLAAEYELDLTASSTYHGEYTPNLLGHRDLGPSACPGQNLYDLLPDLRRLLDGTVEIRQAREQKVDGTPADSLQVLTLRPGQEHDITVAFTNTGNASWTPSTWLFANAGDNVEIIPVAGAREYVAAKLKQRQVLPGETGEFTVRLRAGYNGGVSTISLVPVVNNERVTNAETLQVVEVEPPDWDARFVSIKTQPVEPVSGKATSMSVTLVNNGGGMWDDDRIELLVGVTDTRIAEKFSLDGNTASGRSGVFSGRLPAITTPGEYQLEMRLLLDGQWLPVRFLQPFPVKESENRASALDLSKKVVIVAPGQEYEQELRFRNSGNTEWYHDDLRLTVLHRRDKWTLRPQEDVIEPGEVATFPFAVETKDRVQPYVFLLKDGIQLLDRRPLIMLGLKNPPESRLAMIPQANAAAPTRTPAATPRPAQTREQSDDIRIRLSFPAELGRAVITSPSAFEVTDERGRLLLPARAGSEQMIRQVGPLVQFRDEAYPAIRLSGDILEVANWERFPAWDANKRWNDNVFPGTLEVRVVDGNLTLINELPLEEYLLGLGETIESNHAEKKKAIAVVARSYAQHYLDPRYRKFPGQPYDGSDDPAEFQKYLGANLTKRSPGWQEAVAATAGEVVTYQGEIIKTPFHTSSGGRTTSAQERWGWTDTPYLQSVEDPGCADKAPAGHGVGMSGCGSQHFAEQGWDYREILEYFYQGVEVSKR